MLKSIHDKNKRNIDYNITESVQIKQFIKQFPCRKLKQKINI